MNIFEITLERLSSDAATVEEMAIFHVDGTLTKRQVIRKITQFLLLNTNQSLKSNAMRGVVRRAFEQSRGARHAFILNNYAVEKGKWSFRGLRIRWRRI